jgi:putative ABC transport system ATP-binding protein
MSDGGRASSKAVDLKGVRYSYGATTVLDIDALEISRGERVFLHGPSGSGKTTLLGVLAGILTTQAGTVTVLGEDLAAMRGSRRDAFRGTHIGYIFQMFNLLPYLNVRDNILLPIRLSAGRRRRLAGATGRAASATPEGETAALARRLKIDSLLDRPVTALSVGQQQRVAAARALIGAPELVIADEPTSALDSDHREAFLRLLFDEAERSGASILFVSHDHSLSPLFSRVVPLASINKAAAHQSAAAEA